MTTIEALDSHLRFIANEIQDYMYPPFDDNKNNQVDAEDLLSLLDPLESYKIIQAEETYGYILTLTFGGPNIYLNTFSCRLEGRWGTTYASYPVNPKACQILDAYMDLT